MENPTRIAILVSGKGSNAINLIQQSLKEKDLQVALVLSSQLNVDLNVFCSNAGVAFIHLDPWDTTQAMSLLKEHHVEILVLAGFLKKITPDIIAVFPDRIINLHPSLLPKYGGKGMYGMHVHRKVIENQEIESGITVHLVNEAYDEGKALAQFSCFVDLNDTPESLEQKIRSLEMRHFPAVVFAYCRALKRC
ncbi:MAG: formyltransferase family protein [Bacteroidota bacterium]